MSQAHEDDLQPTSSSSTERPILVEPGQEPAIETVETSSSSVQASQGNGQPNESNEEHKDDLGPETRIPSAERALETCGCAPNDVQPETTRAPRGTITVSSRQGHVTSTHDQERFSRIRPEDIGTDPEDQCASSSGSAPQRIRDELKLDISDTLHWRSQRDETRRSSLVVDTPLRRSHRAFARSGVRQSMNKKQSKLHDKVEEEDEDDEETIESELRSKDGDLMLDGRELELSTFGRAEDEFAPVRLWDKVERAQLPADIRQVFVRSATATVLPKHNKLAAPKIVMGENNKLLTQTLNLHHQLKIIKAHLTSYDIIDVMTIVVPVDVKTKVDVERKKFSLFDDHLQLHAVHVANSCEWVQSMGSEPICL